jgi:tetratricopeptide (TPR) repeat protein
MLKQCTRATLGAFFLCIVLSITGCNKLKARHELNSGVEAYRNGRYEEAIVHWETAARLDPGLKEARIYLDASRRPDTGIGTPVDERWTEQTIEQYKKTLETQSVKSDRIATLKATASLYLDLKKFDQSKDYQRKVLEQDPADTEAYYAIGVIDWVQTFTPGQELRNRLGLKPDAPLKNQKACNSCAARTRRW